MRFSVIDWAVVVGYFGLTLAVGFWTARRAGRSSTEFFLSGRSMPWWLLGLSMVATTFSTDTPNLVADITRTGGVAGNWVWWAFLLTGMLTVFVYARLWRRSGVLTDIEFYEIRYSGRAAAFLRGFRAIYLGVFFNIMVMAAVTLAAIKIGGVMFGLSPLQTIAVASLVTVLFSAAGGLRSVILTDGLLFVVAMTGSIAAAVVALRHPAVGGLEGLLTSPQVAGKLSLLPSFDDPSVFVPLFVVPLAVQWWAAWYPGAEPGGGGYVAQRMLAAKDESHATGATLLFNVAHYALRPWPWILVALCSLVVFPDLESLREAFPHVDPSLVRHDLAYPAMLTFLPAGLMGLVVGSLAAAYMSTISTHLNWGSSYVTHDVYRRFLKPQAVERELVLVGRISTVVLMAAAAGLALLLENALQAFQILLQIGAGTGLLFILRWFWWRINAWSEITAMVVSFAVALVFFFQHRVQAAENQVGGLESWQELLIGVALTTVCWLVACRLTTPTDEHTLRAFYRLTRPGGPGWRAVVERSARDGETLDDGKTPWSVPGGLVCMLAGCLGVYAALFATGYWLYGEYPRALILVAVAVGAGLFLIKTCKNAAGEQPTTTPLSSAAEECANDE
ncbi:MAG: sodium:solute symporter family protein [Thermoanaerobaculia bacterium]